MLDRVTTVEKAVREYVKSGQTIMVGGFGRGGVPFTTIQYLADHADDFGDLTLVKNDANERSRMVKGPFHGHQICGGIG